LKVGRILFLKKKRKERRANVDIHIGQNNEDDDDSGKVGGKLGVSETPGSVNSDQNTRKGPARTETKTKLQPPAPNVPTISSTTAPPAKGFPGWKASHSGKPENITNATNTSANANATNTNANTNANTIGNSSGSNGESKEGGEEWKHKKSNSKEEAASQAKRNSRGDDDTDKDEQTNGQLEKRKLQKNTTIPAPAPAPAPKKLLKTSKAESRDSPDISSKAAGKDKSIDRSTISVPDPNMSPKRKALGRSKSSGSKAVKVSKVTTITTTSSDDSSIVITVNPKSSKKLELS